MNYEYLKNLKKYNHTLKLLCSDNFAMMVAFFYFVFVQKRHIAIAQEQILCYLDDFLFQINQTYPDAFVKSPKDYLDDFVRDNSGYLKRYYGGDGELLYELTPYTQKALEFIESLEKKEFVGSRTKFSVILELLEELIYETSFSDQERIAKLQKERLAIDKKIEAITKGEDIRFDSSRVKESFMLIEEQSRKLLYDFSQIEHNFRELNLLAMERIATTDESKDRVLGSIFEDENLIRESDEGKSFFAFWQILTNSQLSEQFSEMIASIYQLKEIKELDRDERLKDLKFDLISNADKIAKVTSKLMEQLRRFLDERVWVENKKILELCKSVEKKAIEIKENPPGQRGFVQIDGAKVKIESVFEKSLYEIKTQTDLKADIKESEELDIDMQSLYHIFFVDEAKIKQQINHFLQIKEQVALKQVVEKFPVTKGVAEVVAYLSIAKNSKNSIVDLHQKEYIEIEDATHHQKRVSVPKIIYVRETK
ncbi:MAG: DUF3375 domain-containing protein [Epsilonproteobacteria bacterium]|nr:DUF3375 domain-containing protein [Campylobacterota bacterium]